MVVAGTNNKRKVEVSLMGQKFTLRSERSEEHVQAVAKYVANQIEDLRKQTHTVSTHNVALLVALNLADELMQCQEEIQRLKTDIRTKTTEVLQDVDHVLSLIP